MKNTIRNAALAVAFAGSAIIASPLASADTVPVSSTYTRGSTTVARTVVGITPLATRYTRCTVIRYYPAFHRYLYQCRTIGDPITRYRFGPRLP